MNIISRLLFLVIFFNFSIFCHKVYSLSLLREQDKCAFLSSNNGFIVSQDSDQRNSQPTEFYSVLPSPVVFKSHRFHKPLSSFVISDLNNDSSMESSPSIHIENESDDFIDNLTMGVNNGSELSEEEIGSEVDEVDQGSESVEISGLEEEKEEEEEDIKDNDIEGEKEDNDYNEKDNDDNEKEETEEDNPSESTGESDDQQLTQQTSTITPSEQSTHSTSSSIKHKRFSSRLSRKERKKRRYQRTIQRRSFRKNRKKSQRKIRADGYFIVHPVMNRQLDTTPALPQQTPMKPYSLVLFTTADVSKNYYTYKIENCLKMFNLFQRSFNFKGLVFTHSNLIIELAKNESISYITQFELNPYGMPIVRDMFIKATELFDSDYYGYINSDILLSFNIFEILELCKKNAELGNISLRHEIAGRVHEVKLYRSLPNQTLKSYLSYLREAANQMRPPRHIHSADYFIFSKYFNFSSFAPVVIGRGKVDNYLLSIPHQYPETDEDKKYMVGTLDDKFVSKGHLISTTNNVVGIHLGYDGYAQRQRKEHIISMNMDWNLQYIVNIQKSFGSLTFAHCSFPYSTECLKYRYLTKLLSKQALLNQTSV